MSPIRPIVLLVDDNNVNRMILAKHFEKMDSKVIEAINGFEATQILEKQHVDLIFMDIEMPVMDGYTASQLIREKQLSKAPIIALTGHDLKPDKAILRSKGINQLFSKPIKSADIDKIKRRYLAL